MKQHFVGLARCLGHTGHRWGNSYLAEEEQGPSAERHIIMPEKSPYRPDGSNRIGYNSGSKLVCPVSRNCPRIQTSTRTEHVAHHAPLAGEGRDLGYRAYTSVQFGASWTWACLKRSDRRLSEPWMHAQPFRPRSPRHAQSGHIQPVPIVPSAVPPSRARSWNVPTITVRSRAQGATPVSRPLYLRHAARSMESRGSRVHAQPAHLTVCRYRAGLGDVTSGAAIGSLS